MGVGSNSSAGRRQRWWSRPAILLAGAVVAVILFALVVPLAREAQLSHECVQLGGQLQQSMEDAEPLATGRIVYRCVGPGGQLLDEW